MELRRYGLRRLVHARSSRCATSAGTSPRCRRRRSGTAWTSCTARPSARRAARACRSSSPSTTSPSCGTRRPSTAGRGRTARRVLPRVVRAATRLIAVSEFTKRELRRAARRSREKLRVIPNAVGPPFSPTASAAARRLRARRLDARAAQEPAAARRGLPARRPQRPAAARRRRAAAGAASASRATASAGSARSATTSWRGSTAARAASPTSRSTRASGCRCSRRWPAARRSSPPRNGALEEVAGGAAVLVDPLDPDAIAAGLNEAIDRRDELRPLGIAAGARLRLAPGARARRSAVYREAAA